MDKRCTKCGDWFFADADWKRICLTCWKISKGIDPNRGRSRSNYHDAWRPNPPPQQAPVIDAEMLRRLIHLCHPDKHNNSQAAQLATQWLLNQRNKS